MTRHRLSLASGLALGVLLMLEIPEIVRGSVAEGPSAGGAGHFGPILFSLAVLVMAAKMGGLLVQRTGQPPVLGELLVGIVLANLVPPVFGGQGMAVVRGDPTLLVLAEIGVLLLLFDVGLEADIRALARVGWASLAVAVVGVVAPLGLGWAASAWLMPDSPTLTHVFVGATLTATSVGITARVLKDLGATRSREAQIILGAAVIDDVLGLVILAVVSGAVSAAATEGSSLSVLAVSGILLRAVLFLGITVGIGHRLSGPIIRLAARTGQKGMLLVIGVSLCFTLAFVAELVGLADIIGAFAAGLMLDPFGEGVRTREEEATLSELLYPLSSLFVPLFFVLMGIQVHLGSLAEPHVLSLGIALILCALLGKLVCGLGAPRRGMNRLAIGFGMIPRGEVGLIFAGIGAKMTLQGKALLSQGAFSAIVLMVLVTTLVAPLGLRWTLRKEIQGNEKTS